MNADEQAGGFQARLTGLLAEAREVGELEGLAEPLEAAASEARSLHSSAGPRGKVTRRHGMVGQDPAMLALFELIERAAPSNVPMLVLGETGTGKELVARAIHAASKRSQQPFLAENCAAVPANLLESELFGHVRGSFTGASADRKGLFQTADGGTVFLDEIGDMPLEMQSKLLRVLEQGEVRPVGSNKLLQVDVRVVAATHRDLVEMVEQKRFRADLYYRLNVVKLRLPSLRERAGDIQDLVRCFLIEHGGRELDPSALELLKAAPWPGNIRQLENEITRACALSRGVIQVGDLSPEIQTATN